MSLDLPESAMKLMAIDIKTQALQRCDIRVFERICEALSSSPTNRLARSYQWLRLSNDYIPLNWGSKSLNRLKAMPLEKSQLAPADMPKWQRTFTISYDWVSPEQFHGCTLMHAAAFLGLKFLVEFLLYNEFDVNVVSDEGWTPLHFAARGQHFDTIKYLLSQGANHYLAAKNGKLAQDLSEDDFEWSEMLPSP